MLSVTLSLLAACGPDDAVSGRTPSAATSVQAITAQNDLDDELTSAAGQNLISFDADPKVEVRINQNAQVLTQEILPQLVSPFQSLGADVIVIADGGLPAALTTALNGCHSGASNDSDKWTLSMKNVRITPNVRSDSFALEFRRSKQVEAGIDLDDFLMTFDLEFLAPVNDTWWCRTFGTEYRFTTGVTIEGVSGELLATLDVPAAGTVQLASVDDFDADVGTVTLSSDFLNLVAPLGLGLYEIFGAGCGLTINDCVDVQVNEQLEANRSFIQDTIVTSINSMLGPIAQVDGAVNLGSARVDYAVALSSITTSDSKDRLRTLWDVDLSTDRAAASCAAGLTRSTYFTPANTQTTNDLDVLLPYRKITDLMYTVASTGDLCAPFTWNGNSIDVRPNGSFRIEPLFLNLFRVSVPVRVVSVVNPASAAINATLRVTAMLNASCSGGITLVPTGVDLDNATGSITIGGVVLNATAFINNQKAAVENAILGMLGPSYLLAPATFDLPGTGHTLRYGQVLWGENEVTMGVDVIAGSCP